MWLAAFIKFPVNFGAICRPDWIKPGTRVVNLLKLGEAPWVDQISCGAWESCSNDSATK
jgi:hypothetical protein